MYGVEKSGVEMSSKRNFSTPDFSTPDLSTLDFSTMNFPTPDFSTPDLGLKSPGLRNLGLKSSWLKSLGLKSSFLLWGWKVHGWKVRGWKVWGWSLGLKSPVLKCPSTVYARWTGSCCCWSLGSSTVNWVSSTFSNSSKYSTLIIRIYNSSFDFNVAIVAPIWSPGIFDQPIIHPIQSSPTNSKNCMIAWTTDDEIKEAF